MTVHSACTHHFEPVGFALISYLEDGWRPRLVWVLVQTCTSCARDQWFATEVLQ